jgi:hypothetical protein
LYSPAIWLPRRLRTDGVRAARQHEYKTSSFHRRVRSARICPGDPQLQDLSSGCPTGERKSRPPRETIVMETLALAGCQHGRDHHGAGVAPCAAVPLTSATSRAPKLPRCPMAVQWPPRSVGRGPLVRNPRAGRRQWRRGRCIFVTTRASIPASSRRSSLATCRIAIALPAFPGCRCSSAFCRVTLVFFCHAWTLWLYLNWLPSFFADTYRLSMALISSAVFFAGMIGDTVGGLVTDAATW